MDSSSTMSRCLDDPSSFSSFDTSSLSTLAATSHDVLSLEMSHHEMGGYLDPRSFGGSSLQYDDYTDSSYDISGNGLGEQTVETPPPPPAPTKVYSIQQQSIQNAAREDHHYEAQPHGYSQHSQQKYDHSISQSRFESKPLSRPTYPVKTADPATCAQYAPIRQSTFAAPTSVMLGTSSVRRSSNSRTAQKKEPLDPKRVEDEVARNVSQILSATKQQQLAMEAQQKNCVQTHASGATAIQRLAYVCHDCNKVVTSARNLQRHRQSCPALVSQQKDYYSTNNFAISSVHSQPNMADVFQMPEEHHYSNWSSYSAPVSVLSNDLDLSDPVDDLSLMDPHSFPSRLDDLKPLSLDVGDSRTHSSNGSLSSNSTGTSSLIFTCEACKKSVSSLRSLKRHHSTCKSYIAEFGLPPETDASASAASSSTTPMPLSMGARRATAPQPFPPRSHSFTSSPIPSTSSHPCLESLLSAPRLGARRPTSSEIPCEDFMPTSMMTPCTVQQAEPTSSSSCSEEHSASATPTEDYPTSSEMPSTTVNSNRIPKQCLGNNTCEDCNRQLCSASNLKRHRATCKMAMQRLSSQTERSESFSSQSSIIIESPMPRSVGSLPLSSDELRSSHSSSSVPATPHEVTVGEHLKAQRVHQKLLEQHSDQPYNSSTAKPVVIVQRMPLSNQPQHQTHQQFAPLDDHLGYGSGSSTDMSDSEDVNESETSSEEHESLNIKSNDFEAFRKESKPEPKFSTASSGHDYSVKEEKPVMTSGGSVRPLDSIITTQPLESERLNSVYAPKTEDYERRSFDAIRTTLPSGEQSLASPSGQSIRSASGQTDFQCPECLKNYSCRKNVKRHRMAVHKLTSEEVTRNPNTAVPTAVHPVQDSPSTLTLPPLAAPPKQTLNIKRSIDQKTVAHAAPRTISQNSLTPSWDCQPWRNGAFKDEEECAETARIAAELKRSAEQEMADMAVKRPRTELAEADTTVHEEDASGSVTSPRQPMFVNNGNGGYMEIPRSYPPNHTLHNQYAAPPPQSPAYHHQSSLLPPLQQMTSGMSTVDPRSPQVDMSIKRKPVVPHPAPAQKKPYTCTDCNRILSSDYSLRRHRLTCIEVNKKNPSGKLPKEEKSPSDQSALTPPSISVTAPTQDNEVPDSTTSRITDRSTSPGLAIGGSPEDTTVAVIRPKEESFTATTAEKSARHLCQFCGKCYSSEWNLDRHRRESCPTRVKKSPLRDNSTTGDAAAGNTSGSTTTMSDEVHVLVGHTRFMLSRNALSRASAYFSHLFAMHDPTKGELRLELDPASFQNLLDIYNNPANLNPSNIDAVIELSDRLKFKTVLEHCERFISEQLPNHSIMHAIRLAEQRKLTSIKQRLFDSISIDVFRSLAADQHYRMMDSELKAELLEKWGTFL